MSDCHTSSGEWQRFEDRMRRRRADRCLLRACAALDADVPEAAEAVLVEAAALCPKHPDLPEVTLRLRSSNDSLKRATLDDWFPVLLALTLLSLFLASGW
jgi:hypothetical protein